MEHLRESKEEVETVEEEAEKSPHEAHKCVLSDPNPTKDVSNQGSKKDRGKIRETGAPISASLGAMRPLIAKLNKMLLDPSQGCSSKSVKVGMHLFTEDVEKMSSYLDELSEVEDPPLTAKCWMNEARDLSYDMEDYIDSLLFVQPADPSLVANNIKTTRSLLNLLSHVKNPKRL